ncbi:MAG: DUF5693 family protein [Fimbriimonadaceae bacterium]
MIPRWLYPLIALLGLASLVSLSYRYKVEQENKAVGIVAEFDAVEEMAAAEGRTIDAALSRLRASGLGGVVLSEQFIADLVAAEQILMAVKGDTVTLSGPPNLMERVARGLLVRYPGSKPERIGDSVVVRGLAAGLVRRTPIGLDPADASFAQSAGLMIVARHSNPIGATQSYIAATLGTSSTLGATLLLPQGEQVLGRRDALPTMVAELKKLGMRYASAEFGRIGGDQNVVQAAPGIVLRLHAAQAQELDKLPMTEAVDRYVRAAKERNQRVLLLRPVTAAAEKPLAAFGEFVEEVRDGLVESGFDPAAKPHPYTDPGIPRPLFVGIGLLAAPVIFWVGCVFVRDRRLQFVGGALIFLLGLACWTNTGRQFMALFAAIALPTAAFVILDRRSGKHWLPEFLLMSLISFVGGLAVAGLLNGLPYYVRADQFMGVKAAHFAPILLVGLYYFVRSGNVRGSLDSPVRWLQAGLALVVLLGLAFMFTRTGNDSPAAVSGLELKFREILDTILMVRPRTKELLIGHPLLILGIGFLIAGRLGKGVTAASPWLPLLMMGGAIGQTSIVNTMCHLHTPLTLSLARLGVGLVAGGIIGAVLWVLLLQFRPRETKAAAS